jgi:Protein of unknown function (DUF2726)
MHASSTLTIFGIVIAVLLIVVKLLPQFLGGKNKQQDSLPTYEAIPLLFSPAERSFYGVLKQAFATDYEIFAKVRLADIVRPVRNASRSSWQSAFNRIAGKHIDFVLCDREQLRVAVVIELDDRTHERFDRSIRDGLVDSALADSKISILRVTARQNYSPAQIREQVENIFILREQIKNSGI